MGFYSPATRKRRAAPRIESAAGGCDEVGVGVHTEHSALSTQHSAGIVDCREPVVGRCIFRLAPLAQGRLSTVAGQTKTISPSASVPLRAWTPRRNWPRDRSGTKPCSLFFHPRSRSPCAGIAQRRIEYAGGNRRVKFCKPFTTETRGHERNKINHEFSRITKDQFNNQEIQNQMFSVSPCLRGENVFHRRDALWNAGAAANPSGPPLEEIPEPDNKSPLKMMTSEERLVADFRGTGMTVGPHPMAYHRPRLDKLGVCRASDLGQLPSGRKVRTAGCVIARQRPGTAKGFLFLSLEDETGVANAIVTPDLFQQHRLLLTSEPFLMVEGILQNQDGVISIKAASVSSLSITQAQTSSHDFH